MRKNVLIGVGLIAFFFVISISASYALESGEKEPIHIKSKQMEALDKEGKVIFKGDVVAKKGDLTIYADRLVVYYSNKKKRQGGKGKKRLERLVAKGNVRIIQGKRTARGEEAIYDKRKEIITLTGDAQVWEGKNRVKGYRIRVFLKEDKSVVESKPNERVEAVVFTTSESD